MKNEYRKIFENMGFKVLLVSTISETVTVDFTDKKSVLDLALKMGLDGEQTGENEFTFFLK